MLKSESSSQKSLNENHSSNMSDSFIKNKSHNNSQIYDTINEDEELKIK